MTNRDDIVVLIPAYNEESSIAKVIVGVKKVTQAVIVCDDGSTDLTGEISRALGADVLKHGANKGKGRAFATLFAKARSLRPRVVVTIDGDGQHNPTDIPKVVEPVLNGEADVVIGVRPMDPDSMPRERIFGNRMLDGLTSASAGERLHDTQSGFRAYSPDALEKIDFSQPGMATESQTLIDAVGSGLRIAEVPVSVEYSGIPHKWNPLGHLSHVVDYLITRTIVDSPLLYLGVPGIAVFVLGVVAGLRVISLFSQTHQIAVGTALVGVILILVGSVAVSTSLIVKLMTARFQGAR